MLGILRCVILARFLGDSVVLRVGVHTESVTAVACATARGTVDENLHAEFDVGESTVSHDVNSVCKCRGRTESPARSAVGRDVLVAGDREVVDTISVSPVPHLRETKHIDVLIRFRGDYEEIFRVAWKSHTGFGRSSEVYFIVGSCLGGWLGCRVSHIVCPSVDGGGPTAVRLDVEGVNATDDAEEPLFAPV